MSDPLPLGPAASDPAATGPVVTGPVVTGTVLGDYRILNCIGRGGMGVVYQAERIDGIGPLVALKVLEGSYDPGDPELKRFIRESAAVSSLDHPHVVRALAPLTITSERAFFPMMFCAGHDLAKLVRTEGPLPPERATTLASQLLDALDFAHARGVVHRDVKPQNVLVDADGNARLADFGLARLSGHTALTKTGSALGTPLYMAPEQVDGDPPTAAADIYAVGVVLFELLTGKPPFTAEKPLAVLLMHREAEIPPLIAEPPVPTALAQVVRRALAKSPADRWPSANAMRHALAPFRQSGSSSVAIGTGIANVIDHDAATGGSDFGPGSWSAPTLTPDSPPVGPAALTATQSKPPAASPTRTTRRAGLIVAGLAAVLLFTVYAPGWFGTRGEGDSKPKPSPSATVDSAEVVGPTVPTARDASASPDPSPAAQAPPASDASRASGLVPTQRVVVHVIGERDRAGVFLGLDLSAQTLRLRDASGIEQQIPLASVISYETAP